MVIHLMRVLEDAAADWELLGWTEAARDYIPSLPQAVVILTWDGDGNPPIPNEVENAV